MKRFLLLAVGACGIVIHPVPAGWATAARAQQSPRFAPAGDHLPDGAHPAESPVLIPRGARFEWPGERFDFEAGDGTASGEAGPPLRLRVERVHRAESFSIEGRRLLESDSLDGHNTVWVPFAGGVETFDILSGPAAPRTIRWQVSSDGEALMVDADRGTASRGEGTVVARFDGVTATDASGGDVPVAVRAGLGFLDISLSASIAANRYPVVIDPTWNRTDRRYREYGFFPTTHNYRVRGYNFQRCIQTGNDCRTEKTDRYRPEATAQSHALRRLAKLYGGARLPDGINWEVGHNDDPTEDPPCDGTAGFRVDIVKDVSDFSDFGRTKYRIIEVKNVERVGDVEGQLACYEQKMKDLNVGRLADLSDDHWAVYWDERDTKTRWYAWAPQPGYVLFGNLDQDSDRIPASVIKHSHRTGHERVDLGETTPDPFPFLPIPVPVPVPVS